MVRGAGLVARTTLEPREANEGLGVIITTVSEGAEVRAGFYLVGAVRFELTTTGTPCRYATRLRYAPRPRIITGLILSACDQPFFAEAMQVQAESDELTVALGEARTLKDTVRALRDTLEQERIDKERAVQGAVAEAHNELVQLKATAAALRDGLEQARIDREKAVQLAVVAGAEEITQLKSAAGALRETLEQARIDKERAVQAAVAAGHDEIRQLKATTASLREGLE